jgi:ATP-dependent Clp protease protease subunit
MISSGGGNITAAFAAYNEIRSMPIELETLNTGATDSPALMIFMAGKKRYACARSAFQLRQSSWSFPSKDDVALSVIADTAKWLQEYQRIMAETIAEGTDGRLTSDKVVEMIQAGTTLNPQQAKDIGLIHDIIEPTIPRKPGGGKCSHDHPLSLAPPQPPAPTTASKNRRECGGRSS